MTTSGSRGGSEAGRLVCWVDWAVAAGAAVLFRVEWRVALASTALAEGFRARVSGIGSSSPGYRMGPALQRARNEDRRRGCR